MTQTPFDQIVSVTARSATQLPPAVLIVPGLHGSSESHWQSVWERERSDCRRVDLGQWDAPTPARWLARLESTVRETPGPSILVAHSLGCIAAALWAYARRPDSRVIGALLVAPCDPEADSACKPLRRFAPAPRTRFPFPTTLVASANDPYATLERSREMAQIWGSEFVAAGALGHINADSGLGAWPAGQQLLANLIDRAAGRYGRLSPPSGPALGPSANPAVRD